MATWRLNPRLVQEGLSLQSCLGWGWQQLSRLLVLQTLRQCSFSLVMETASENAAVPRYSWRLLQRGCAVQPPGTWILTASWTMDEEGLLWHR